MSASTLDRATERLKTYRQKLTSSFGFEGVWDGRKRPARVPVRPQPRQPYGGLSPEEFEALTPEKKIALANGEKI